MRTARCLGFVFVATLAAGLALADEPPDLERGQVHRDEAGGFAITFPVGWTVTGPTDGGPAVQAVSPIEPDEQFPIAVNVTFEEVPADWTLERYVKTNLEQAAEAFDEFEVLEQREDALDERPAAWIVCNHRHADLPVRSIFLIQLDGKGRGYVVTGASVREVAERKRPVLEAILRTFRMLR